MLDDSRETQVEENRLVNTCLFGVINFWEIFGDADPTNEFCLFLAVAIPVLVTVPGVSWEVVVPRNNHHHDTRDIECVVN